jgi:hypothetical protein
VQIGAKDIGEMAMSSAERDVANTFAFADHQVHAKDIQQGAKELGEAAS